MSDQIREGSLADLKFDQDNANAGSEYGTHLLRQSVQDLGIGRGIVAAADGTIIGGNHVAQMLGELGMERVVFVPTDGKTLVVTQRTDIEPGTKEFHELALADNKVAKDNLRFDEQKVAELITAFAIDADKWGFDLPDDFGTDGSSEGAVGSALSTSKDGALHERFIVPPFTVLDARQGYWQERKNAWLSLGFRSVSGRAGTETYADSSRPKEFYRLRNEMRDNAGGVDPTWDEIHAEAVRRGIGSDATGNISIFDPVLAELSYRWFCPSAGVVLDPFAGGSVRGIVAARLGYPYTGIDLRPEQVEENRRQAAQFLPDTAPAPVWITGNSLSLNSLVGDMEADFIFSCPPYADLEVYSDDPADLSNMPYDEFARQYTEIIGHAVARLKPDRFACFVVGDVRDKKGFYRNFVGLTIQAFETSGARYYNEAVLVTQVASAAIRANQFTKGRKLCKTHQNVLVFYKGDPKQIKVNFPEIDVHWPDVEEAESGEIQQAILTP